MPKARASLRSAWEASGQESVVEDANCKKGQKQRGPIREYGGGKGETRGGKGINKDVLDEASMFRGH